MVNDVTTELAQHPWVSDFPEVAFSQPFLSLLTELDLHKRHRVLKLPLALGVLKKSY